MSISKYFPRPSNSNSVFFYNAEQWQASNSVILQLKSLGLSTVKKIFHGKWYKRCELYQSTCPVSSCKGVLRFRAVIRGKESMGSHVQYRCLSDCSRRQIDYALYSMGDSCNASK